MDNSAKPTWKAQGRYDYWAVDEFRDDEPGNAVYGTVDTFRSKRQAERLAAALNAAYARGNANGYDHGFKDGYGRGYNVGTQVTPE